MQNINNIVSLVDNKTKNKANQTEEEEEEKNAQREREKNKRINHIQCVLVEITCGMGAVAVLHERGISNMFRFLSFACCFFLLLSACSSLSPLALLPHHDKNGASLEQER